MNRRTQLPIRRTLLTALTLLLAVPAAAFNGRVPVLRTPEGVYRGAAEIAAGRGWDFAPEGEHGFRLSGGGATLVFEEGSRIARLDRVVIYLNFPPAPRRRRALVSPHRGHRTDGGGAIDGRPAAAAGAGFLTAVAGVEQDAARARLRR